MSKLVVDNLDSAIQASIDAFRGCAFSTKEFIDEFSLQNIKAWRAIETAYGVGGKGAGRHFSSFSFISQQLNKKHRRNELIKLEYAKAPKGYGSPVIRYWTTQSQDVSNPESDAAEGGRWFEGACKQVTSNRYERNYGARDACISHYGYSCTVCKNNFEDMYGLRGHNFIHVHHLKPLKFTGKRHEVDPIKDLRPVCANCHAMIHFGPTMLSIEEARSIWRGPKL